MHAPTTLHWQDVKRILKYLNGTLHHYLHFKLHTTISLLAYSDSGWMSDKDDNRSQYDFANFHVHNLISCTSCKQKVVARSSIEAEYNVLEYTTIELLWIQHLLRDLHVHLPKPPILLCDNVGATFMCKNQVISTQSKHIALDFYFLIEQVDVGALQIYQVSCMDQLADIFTKPMEKDQASQLQYKLQVQPQLELVGRGGGGGVITTIK